MMQLMQGFCRNSSCNEAQVRQVDNETNCGTMTTIYTLMCPSINRQFSVEELEAYGVDSQGIHCAGAAACTYAHD
jgi:hypothetical protein